MEFTTKITDKNVLNEKVTELMKLQAQIEKLNEMAEAIKSDIKEVMGNDEEIVTEDYTIRWTKYERRFFDQYALKLFEHEIYEKFMTSSESRRFSIN